MNDVRELLERAAEEAGQPAVTAEVVYARAARARRRRRVAVSAAAVCAVAAGAFVVPALSAGQGQAPHKSSVAAPGKPVGNTERARKLIKLLPEGVGAVAQVSMADIVKDRGTAQHVVELSNGPLDGLYTVRRDGGVGFIEVGGAAPPGFLRSTNVCAGVGAQQRRDCVREELPDGRVLTLWDDPMNLVRSSLVQWGPELSGWLTLKDGRRLAVRASTGFEGDAALGPLLKSPPLTRAQLRTLMLRPELLPKK